MKRLLTLLLAALLLTACGDAAAIPSNYNAELVFVRQVRMGSAVFASASREDLLTSGRATCATLDEGRTFDEALLTASSLDAEHEAASTLLSASVVNLCREHGQALRRWATLNV